MATQAEIERDSSHGLIDNVLEVVEYVAVGIEVLAVLIIVVSIAIATLTYVTLRFKRQDAQRGYERYRAQLGAGLLLGLEILVAADVIRTVALEQTLESVGTLGVLVLIRIVLSWSIVVEIEQRWPWQREGTPGGMPPEEI